MGISIRYIHFLFVIVMTQEELNAKAARALTGQDVFIELSLAEPETFYDWKFPFIHKRHTVKYVMKPATLGKLQLIAARILPLGLNTDDVMADPVQECLKCVEKNAQQMAEVIAIIVTDEVSKLRDREYIEQLGATFKDKMTLTDLSMALAMCITTIDYAGFYSVLRLKKILDFKNTNRRTSPNAVEK